MKVYLDDWRPAPEGWRLCTSAFVLCHWLENYSDQISEISLDHDLGLENECGYDVLLWIEKEMILNSYVPPKIKIHTANPSARQKMELALEKIERLRNEI